MKIRRFVARDMKTALAQIKEELGAEAVIMSNKRIAEGVELMAAVDYAQPNANMSESGASQINEHVNASEAPSDREIQNDVVQLSSSVQADRASETSNSVQAPQDSLSALLDRKIQHTPQSPPEMLNPTSTIPENVQLTPSQPVDIADAPLDIEQQFKKFTDRLEQSSPESINQDAYAQAQSMGENKETESLSEQSGFESQHYSNTNNTPVSKPTSAVNQGEISQMQKEMASIRQLLEHQVSGLMWQDMAQRDPRRAYLVNRLTDMGLTEQVADQISGYLPADLNEEDAWEQAKHLLSQQLNTTQNDIVHRGGVFALVGPTGVGKTTTIAKLAARFAQIHGADQVVLISTDSYRIAGFEQLSTYGRIIGCQVKQAHDTQALDTMLQQFANKKLILIDTAGMGQRDMRLVKHLTTLVANARVRIRNYLVLSANTQQKVMQENVDRFKAIPLSGCIFTKLDESVSAGEVIATSIQNALPIGYLTDGQRVPEDIKVANAEKLVTLADVMARKYSPTPQVVKQSMPAMSSAMV